MNVAASGRTWEEASSPDALRLTRGYEEAWQRAELPARGLIRPSSSLDCVPAGSFQGLAWPSCGRTCRCAGTRATA